MLKFKAAILIKKNYPLEIEEITIDKPLGYGQVLVKIFYSGICGSQIGEITGKKKDPYIPHLLGHEGFGEVMEVGPEVKTCKIGDKVILHWKIGAGIQSDPPKYLMKNKVINAGWITTFNQYAIVSENRLTTITPSFKNNYLYPLFGCAIPTAFGAVENLACIKFSQKILIIGVGGIGLSILQACKFMHSSEVYCIDIDKNKLNLAKSLGADKVFLVDKFNLEFLKKFKGYFDHCFENTGFNKNIEYGYNCIKTDGKLVLIGVPKISHKSKLFTLDLHFGKKLIGCHGGNIDPNEDIPRYISFFNKRENELKNIVTNKDKLNNINSLVDKMKKGLIVGRAIISLW